LFFHTNKNENLFFLSLFIYKKEKLKSHGDKTKQFILDSISRIAYELFFVDSFCDVDEVPPSFTLFGNNI
jgi:hypothetical protein